MRPIELARAVEVSTQHVRNLEAEGVLPAASRSKTGYRSYTQEHLSALRAYTKIAEAHGVPHGKAIMRAVVTHDVSRALALIDRSHVELDEQRRTLGGISEALAGMVEEVTSGAPQAESHLCIGEVAGLLRIKSSTVRVWEAAGLVRSRRDPTTGYRIYTEAEVREARTVRLLREGGYSFDRIRPVLEGIRREGSTDALRNALCERRRHLDERGWAMLSAAALLHQHLEDFGNRK